MLTSLEIKNYALIDHLEMTPSEQLNMITGETGAGKSIMLGAVGLITGNRADTKVLLNEEAKCVVEGIFQIDNYEAIQTTLKEADIEYDPQCIIRREISPSGKSRAFVNDQPVTLDVLKNIGQQLIDIHSQHETLQLGSHRFQLYLIDLFAETRDLRNNYKQSYERYTSLKKDFEDLKQNAANLAKDHDYHSFLLQELKEAQLEDRDQESLENELNTLENAEEIKSNLNDALGNLDRSDYSAIHSLEQAKSMLARLDRYSEQYAQLSQRLESSHIELKDIISELEALEDGVEHDPRRIEEVNDQLNQLYRLQKKHQVDSVTSLIELKEELQEKVNKTTHLDDELERLEIAVEEALKDLTTKGEKLSQARQGIFTVLENKVVSLLQDVGIKDASLTVTNQLTSPGPEGIDNIDILFSANKGVAPQEIKTVASGGEFSRLMFVLKYLLAHKTKLPTIIFDEIDTGVSGEIALKMVRMMKKMANNHQIISISHLPQFAAQGDAHYYVYKDSEEERAVSRIRKLEGDERILEIAKMIGGDEPSQTAVVNARELMSS